MSHLISSLITLSSSPYHLRDWTIIDISVKANIIKRSLCFWWLNKKVHSSFCSSGSQTDCILQYTWRPGWSQQWRCRDPRGGWRHQHPLQLSSLKWSIWILREGSISFFSATKWTSPLIWTPPSHTAFNVPFDRPTTEFSSFLHSL